MTDYVDVEKVSLLLTQWPVLSITLHCFDQLHNLHVVLFHNLAIIGYVAVNMAIHV